MAEAKAKAPSKAAAAVVKPQWGVLRCVSDPGLFVAGVDLPGMRTRRGKNGSHRHWRASNRANGAEREAVRLVVDAWLRGLTDLSPAPPYVVTLIRRAPSEGLDDDNLIGALAYVRDGVADALGVGDGPRDPVVWRYAQERGPWGVRVEIVWGDAPGKASGE